MSGVGVFIFSVLLFSARAIPVHIDEIKDGKENQYPIDSIYEQKESRSANYDYDDESSSTLLSGLFDLASTLLRSDSDSDDTLASAIGAAPYPGGYYGCSNRNYGPYRPPPLTKPPRQRPNLYNLASTLVGDGSDSDDTPVSAIGVAPYPGGYYGGSNLNYGPYRPPPLTKPPRQRPNLYNLASTLVGDGSDSDDTPVSAIGVAPYPGGYYGGSNLKYGPYRPPPLTKPPRQIPNLYNLASTLVGDGSDSDDTPVSAIGIAPYPGGYYGGSNLNYGPYRPPPLTKPPRQRPNLYDLASTLLRSGSDSDNTPVSAIGAAPYPGGYYLGSNLNYRPPTPTKLPRQRPNVYVLASTLLHGDRDSDDTPASAIGVAPYPGGYYGGSNLTYAPYRPPPLTKPPRQRPNVYVLASTLLGGDSDSNYTPASALGTTPYPGGHYEGSDLLIFPPPPHVVDSLVYPTRRPPSYIGQNIYNPTPIVTEYKIHSVEI